MCLLLNNLLNVTFLQLIIFRLQGLFFHMMVNVISDPQRMILTYLNTQIMMQNLG